MSINDNVVITPPPAQFRNLNRRKRLNAAVLAALIAGAGPAVFASQAAAWDCGGSCVLDDSQIIYDVMYGTYAADSDANGGSVTMNGTECLPKTRFTF